MLEDKQSLLGAGDGGGRQPLTNASSNFSKGGIVSLADCGRNISFGCGLKRPVDDSCMLLDSPPSPPFGLSDNCG